MTSTDASKSEIETAVRDVLNRLQETWTANDADAVADLYTEDATLVMTGVFINGREEIRKFMAEAFAGQLAGSRPHNVPRIIRKVGADTAVVNSDIGLILAGNDDVAEGDERVATWALTLRDGRWLIAAYHNCPVG
ncbi:SgcJ/EcaC family oxidoreductase [Streptomyces sp. NPDC050997]|uniref:SgcJ/EcaC family oxidoreductase n=1 Tax=Streptomyces sp. NPDC050997 TaxID=3155519 RepID=UPI003441D5CB